MGLGGEKVEKSDIWSREMGLSGKGIVYVCVCTYVYVCRWCAAPIHLDTGQEPESHPCCLPLLVHSAGGYMGH